jgi:predicted Zn-dependent peptidase
MKVNQGKFAMCFRTNNNILNGDYFALAVMNSILGGGTHSKLFNEVREKHSLAYYCYSFIEKFKGLMIITAGVDSSKFKNARDISIEQLEKIKNGIINDQEFNSSRTKLISDLRTVEDSQYNTVDYIAALRAYNVNYNICDIIEGIEKVTVDRVVEAAKKIELDTVYFLDSEE